MRNSRGERMSGSGFQYGDRAVAALAQTPEGAFVAHLVVGFDGGVNGMIYSKTSSYPVHVQCGNSTSGSRHNATFLVFFPFPKAPSRQIRKSCSTNGRQATGIQTARITQEVHRSS